VDETIGAGSLELGNDINDGDMDINPYQGIMAVDARNPYQRGRNSALYTLGWGDNPELIDSAQSVPVQNSEINKTANFITPATNFYNGVVTDISITGIGNPENGKTIAMVKTPKQSSKGGCNAIAGLGYVMFALIVIHHRRRRRGYLD
jgi:hypothetical protein